MIGGQASRKAPSGVMVANHVGLATLMPSTVVVFVAGPWVKLWRRTYHSRLSVFACDPKVRRRDVTAVRGLVTYSTIHWVRLVFLVCCSQKKSYCIIRQTGQDSIPRLLLSFLSISILTSSSTKPSHQNYSFSPTRLSESKSPFFKP